MTITEPYRMIGDRTKCPACGIKIDPEATLCPNCKTTFCYKTHLIIYPNHPRYRCMNMKCECFGKLLSKAGVIEIPTMGTQTLTRTEKIYSRRAIEISAIVSLVLSSLLLLYLSVPWWGVIGGGFVIAILVSGIVGNQTKDVSYVEPIEIGRSKVCIACHSPVEHLNE